MEKYLKFIHDHRNLRWYQPIIFESGIMEINGKWNESTKNLSKQLLYDVAGKSVLDVGCNVGFFLHEAHRQGASRIVGIDNDPQIIDLARQVAQLLSFPVILHLDDAFIFNPDETFDLILMLNILDFIQHPERCISKYIGASNTLIIEHEEHHKEYFPSDPQQSGHSERAGGRLLSIFGNSIDI